jgi:DNA-binding MarR family transcriptional regulator
VSEERPLSSEFEHPEDSTGLLLWRATNAWQAAQRAALGPFGLTHVQFVLLAALTWLGADEPPTQQQLAGYARTDPMMTSQVVRVLETAGLVERAQHPTDGRARLLRSTAAGAALANRAMVAVEDCDRTFFAALDSDRTTFTSMLGRLA